MNKKLLPLREVFEVTKDWFVKVTTAIIRDTSWKILCIYDNSINKWNTPWWKVDKWETPEQSIVREVLEELWIKVIEKVFLWTRKTISKWLWEVHYFDVKVDWIPENKERDKHSEIVYFWNIKSKTKLWIKFFNENIILDDHFDILNKLPSLYWYYNWILNYNGDEFEIPHFENIKEEELYIQYFDISDKKYKVSIFVDDLLLKRDLYIPVYITLWKDIKIYSNSPDRFSYTWF